MAQFDVSISGSPFAFNPSSVTIARGDTVKWTNKTTATHTATGDNG
jgi:plastocyanin